MAADGYLCRGAKVMANSSLKSAMHADADVCGVPRKALADLVGISGAALYGALDEAQPTQQMSLSRFVTFLHVTGGAASLDYLAGLCGAVVYRLPHRGRTVDATTARTVREFGELLAAVADAHADGRIDDDEADRVMREGREAIAAIAALLDDVESRKRPSLSRPMAVAR